MPRDEHGIRITESYRQRLLATRRTVTLRALPLWRAVDLEDFSASFAQLAPVFTALVSGGQGVMVTLAGSYATAYLRNELQDPLAVAVTSTERVGQTVGGEPLREMLGPVAVTVMQALRLGWEPGRASRAGWNKLARGIAWQTISAAHLALGDTIRDTSEIGGWRRVASQNSCGACLGAADGALEADDVGMHRHSHCRCVAAPVVRGVRERARFQTGQELFDALDERQQAELFAGRGGEAKAAVARERGVGVLVQRDHTETAGTLITERPLEAIV